MNIKKQIILDDKDYERLVHDANLSNDEIKSKIASALTTDMVFSFDFEIYGQRSRISVIGESSGKYWLKTCLMSCWK